jgi:tetratricopeptide (TPR) repeat protein
LLLASTAWGQQWLGPSKISGVVLDENEKPLAGATVEAFLPQTPDIRPPAATTSRRGHFVIPQLVPGEWFIRIQAEGYVLSEGRVLVELDGSEPLRVVLRPLSEVTPNRAESPTAVRDWIQRGNGLLQQGDPAAARSEYEKTLNVLPEAAQPEILRAIARSHIEEQEPDKAVEILKRALVFDPQDADSRRFFSLLLEAMQRPQEATAWLARLDAEGPEALRDEVSLPPPPPRGNPLRMQDDIEPLEPKAGRRGRYRVRFRERSPLGALEVIESRYGYDHQAVLATDPAASSYDLADESFEVFAPEVEGDPHADAPMGLIVWVSPIQYGHPYAHFLDVLRKHRMLWVGANSSGNPRPGWDRISLALDGAHNMQKLYDIDPERIYVAGYSGGGRISTGLSLHFPEVFQGGFFVYGCDFYRNVDAPDKPGMIWPAPFDPPPRDILKLIKKRNRYVFLTGEHDFNRLQTRTNERLYREEGFRHTTYLEIPEATHYTRVPAEWLDRALIALEP